MLLSPHTSLEYPGESRCLALYTLALMPAALDECGIATSTNETSEDSEVVLAESTMRVYSKVEIDASPYSQMFYVRLAF